MSNLKFISTGSTTVTLSGNVFSNNFYANNSAYTIGTTIELADGQSVQFFGTKNDLCKDASHFYQFVIGGTGTVTVEGDLISLINNFPYIKQFQFANLFKNCNKITSISGLNFPTSIADYCYLNMFMNCTGLVNASTTLPAGHLARWCYANMFAGCTSLIDAPSITAIDIAQYSLYCMFYNCSSLKDAPQLYVKQMDKTFSCNSMFRNCQNLSSITISFKTLANNNNETKGWVHNVASNGTFTKSITLTSYIEGDDGIPANWTIVETYPSIIVANDQIFEFNAREQSVDIQTLAYTYNGQQTMTFNYDSNLLPSGVTFANGTFSGVGLDMNYPTTSVTSSVPITLSTTTLDAIPVTITATINLVNIPTAVISIATIPTINWDFEDEEATTSSINLASYVSYNGNSTLSTQIIGELPEGVVYQNGILSASKDNLTGNYRGTFDLSAFASDARSVICSDIDFEITGVIPYYSTIPLTFRSVGNTYIKRSNFSNDSNIKYRKNYGQYWNWFYHDYLNDGDIIEISGNANATSWSGRPHFETSGDGSLFVYGNLMSLYNYVSSFSQNTYGAKFKEIFYGCTNIVDASNLYMSLTNGPNQCCMGMFYGCTALTAAPSLAFLPNLTGSEVCSEMFRGCTSLKTPPVMPETLTNVPLSGFRYMFEGCTSLTASIPLPATGVANYCYGWMFYNCSSLKEIPSSLPATTLAQGCYNSMFQGCSSLSSAPILPATTLVNNCYSDMFNGCTNLSTAPDLPATQLVDYCYHRLFYNCSKLSSINVNFTNWTNGGSMALYSWIQGVASNGTFYKPSDLSEEYAVNRIPNNWTVINK